MSFTSALHSINYERELYVVHTTDDTDATAKIRVTYLPWRGTFATATAVHQWIKSKCGDIVHRGNQGNGKRFTTDIQAPTEELIGTSYGYEEYMKVMNAAEGLCLVLNLTCDVLLSPQLVGNEGKHVEVLFPTTLNDFNRNKVIFWVGRTNDDEHRERQLEVDCGYEHYQTWLPLHVMVDKRAKVYSKTDLVISDWLSTAKRIKVIVERKR